MTTAVTQPSGATSVSTSSAGNIFYGSAVVHTTGALSIAMALSGTTGVEINWEYAAQRLR